MVQGRQAWEGHAWFYTEMEQGHKRWVAKSSVYWSASSVYLSDNTRTNINAQVSAKQLRSSPQGVCNTD